MKAIQKPYGALLLSTVFGLSTACAPQGPSPTPRALPAAPRPTPILPIAGGAPEPGSVTLRWLGQATFLMTTAQGTKILIDPIPEDFGYAVAPLEGIAAVTVGHEHRDHNNVGLAKGNPVVLRGLSSDGWNQIDQRVKEVRIRSVATYHDEAQGSQRGRNTIFVFEVGDLRLAHLSDLGHVLTPEQVQAVGPVDVVMIPAGGFYTIAPEKAGQVVDQLRPKVVIPMHYKTPRMRADWPGTAVEEFLKGKAQVQRPGSATLQLAKGTVPATTTIVVLNYE